MTDARALTAENSRLHVLMDARKAAEKREDRELVALLDVQIERRIQLIGSTRADVPPTNRTPVRGSATDSDITPGGD